MPAVEQWESYFDVVGILESLGCRDLIGDAVEFGCGYGTFTIPLARMILGTLIALDIDPLMVAATAARTSQVGLNNIIIEQRDFVAQGCGRKSGSAVLVLLFNILHIEDPVSLLKEANRVLHPGGSVGVIHEPRCAHTPRSTARYPAEAGPMSGLGRASGIAMGSEPAPAWITVALGYGTGQTLTDRWRIKAEVEVTNRPSCSSGRAWNLD
jgi:SAM-dependent methyltransferase